MEPAADPDIIPGIDDNLFQGGDFDFFLIVNAIIFPQMKSCPAALVVQNDIISFLLYAIITFARIPNRAECSGISERR